MMSGGLCIIVVKANFARSSNHTEIITFKSRRLIFVTFSTEQYHFDSKRSGGRTQPTAPSYTFERIRPFKVPCKLPLGIGL